MGSFPRPQPLPEEFAQPLARAADRLGPFGRRIIWYPEISSTNDVAAALAERGARDGCVVTANAQSAGRGRQGRVWVSPPGAGLYVSTVLHPRHDTIPLLTIAAGAALAEGIHAATGLEPHMKWPNDVYVGDRKLAGVLAEAGSAPSNVGADLSASATLRRDLAVAEGEGRQVGPGAGVPYVILGFGINVMPAAYPPDIAACATSLEGELGRAVDRGLLLAECLSCLAARYADLQDGRAGLVTDAWRARARPTLGRTVRWDAGGSALQGVAEDIDDTGALMVRTGAGLVRIISGEVRWI